MPSACVSVCVCMCQCGAALLVNARRCKRSCKPCHMHFAASDCEKIRGIARVCREWRGCCALPAGVWKGCQVALVSFPPQCRAKVYVLLRNGSRGASDGDVLSELSARNSKWNLKSRMMM